MTSKQRLTSHDVARESGLSRATVSYVLNNDPRQTIPEETRQRVLRAARKLGYRPSAPARALRAGFDWNYRSACSVADVLCREKERTTDKNGVADLSFGYALNVTLNQPVRGLSGTNYGTHGLTDIVPLHDPVKFEPPPPVAPPVTQCWNVEFSGVPA